MSQLIDNLNTIESVKTDIKTAIENKGVDMTGVSFPGYASKIGEISGGGVKPSGSLEISENGVYDVYSYASASVDVHPSASLSETYTSNGNYDITGEFNGGVITVDVPQSVTGFTEKDITEGVQIVNLSNSASYVREGVFTLNQQIQTVYLPNCTNVENSAFQQCYSLTQVSLPMCSRIGDYVFQKCRSLTQVSLPMCSTIGWYAFQECRSLTQVNLPVCSRIDVYAFWLCSSLSIITIGYSSICSLNRSNVFTSTQITSSTGSIYVPASLVDAYKSAENWSYFSTQIFPIPE